MTTTAQGPLRRVPGWTAAANATLAAFAGASTRYGTHGAVEIGTLGIRFGGVPAGLTPSHDDLIQAVRAAKLKGDPLLDKEDSLMARLPLSGDIGIFIVDAEYNALQAQHLRCRTVRP